MATTYTYPSVGESLQQRHRSQSDSNLLTAGSTESSPGDPERGAEANGMRRLGSMGDISPAKASHQKKKGFFHKLVRPWKWRKRGKRGGGEKGIPRTDIVSSYSQEELPVPSSSYLAVEMNNDFTVPPPRLPHPTTSPPHNPVHSDLMHSYPPAPNSAPLPLHKHMNGPSLSMDINNKHRRSGELKVAQRSSIDVPPRENRRESTPPYAAGKKESEPTVPPKITDMRNLKESPPPASPRSILKGGVMYDTDAHKKPAGPVVTAVVTPPGGPPVAPRKSSPLYQGRQASPPVTTIPPPELLPPPPGPRRRPQQQSDSNYVVYSPNDDESSSEEDNVDGDEYNDDDEEDEEPEMGGFSKVLRHDSVAILRERRKNEPITTQTAETKAVVEKQLERRLSLRPPRHELEARNILKGKANTQRELELEEMKANLTRKLSRRPTVKELRERNILKFAEYAEVVECEDYDRRADKPWTRLRPEDKAAIRKELNEFKKMEMEVHPDSQYMTRFHKP
ncbi:PREDICTED: phosphatase and actin regulator 4B-like [Amphimedon queenslandica]|uniref:Phosphatase and actin regulator n=1 Tax=Amphimedon queenslandica TaxID=400682 RepID=A0A1X7VMT2_AMPQE|nr:PREDICTED: phosphatase and actin regulator 4B-like [Amphimedon queenslandica]|eukprot:XP_003383494.1 PREDICTED: phosphatase and actin regulator 4B-like [Amphimedon queenslandica]